MKVFLRVVATLFVTIFLFLGSTQTQAQHEGVIVPVYVTMDGKYTLSPTSELAFNAWAVGSQGTVSARVNLDGTVTFPLGKRFIVGANIGIKFNLYHGLTGPIAPTGTRRILEVGIPQYTENPRAPKRGVYLSGYQFVGLTSSWVKAQELIAANPGAKVVESGYAWVGPSNAKALYVLNDNPAGVVYNPEPTGNYISRFDLSTLQREDIFSREVLRQIDFDQSREAAFTPAGGFATVRAKVQAAVVSQEPLFRLAALPFEKTGKVVHLGSNTAEGKIWMSDPMAGTAELNFFGNELVEEGNLQGAIFGNALFRVVGTQKQGNFYTQGKVYVYSLDTGVILKQIPVPFLLGTESDPIVLRPQISFSPQEGVLYIAVPETGKLLKLNVASEITTEVVLVDGWKAKDVKVDSARGVFYVAVARLSSENGKLLEFPFGTSVPLRFVEVGKSPWQITVGAVAGTNTVFVTNNNDGSPFIDRSDDSLSRIQTNGFAETGKLVTLNQPTSIVVQAN